MAQKVHPDSALFENEKKLKMPKSKNCFDVAIICVTGMPGAELQHHWVNRRHAVN